MGFAGKKALALKRAYICVFNGMKEQSRLPEAAEANRVSPSQPLA